MGEFEKPTQSDGEGATPFHLAGAQLRTMRRNIDLVRECTLHAAIAEAGFCPEMPDEYNIETSRSHIEGMPWNFIPLSKTIDIDLTGTTPNKINYDGNQRPTIETARELLCIRGNVQIAFSDKDGSDFVDRGSEIAIYPQRHQPGIIIDNLSSYLDGERKFIALSLKEGQTFSIMPEDLWDTKTLSFAIYDGLEAVKSVKLVLDRENIVESFRYEPDYYDKETGVWASIGRSLGLQMNRVEPPRYQGIDILFEAFDPITQTKLALGSRKNYYDVQIVPQREFTEEYHDSLINAEYIGLQKSGWQFRRAYNIPMDIDCGRGIVVHIPKGRLPETVSFIHRVLSTQQLQPES